MSENLKTISKCVVTFVAGLLFVSSNAAAVPVVMDFEADDGGNALINGQAIDTFAGPGTLEFGNIVDVTSGSGEGHLGAAIFDSSPNGPNANSGDKDLLVDLGNILIGQSSDSPDYTVDGTYGKVFDEPNDWAGTRPGTTLILAFHDPVEMLSVDLIDIDSNRGALVTLVDSAGREREYVVPRDWTKDIYSDGPDGYDTLDLTILSNQPGEGSGGSATASEDLGFNPMDVLGVEVRIIGSGGMDNLTFDPDVYIPEPATLLVLVVSGLMVLGSRALRRRRAGRSQ